MVGGMYGFARLTIGPYMGFIIGCCEVLQNILRASCFMFCFAMHCCVALDLPMEYEPCFWLVFLALTLPLNIIGGKVFWRCAGVLSVISVLIIILYLVSTAHFADFEKEVLDVREKYDSPAIEILLMCFPYSTWFFVGMEMVPVMSSDVKMVSKLLLVLYTVL